MNYGLPSSKDFADEAQRLGFADVGVAACVPVEQSDMEIFDRWVADGRNAGMEYMERYREVRRDPRLLLDGARSIIMAAAGYYHAVPADEASRRAAGAIAAYAHGDDYHEVLRRRLDALAYYIRDRWGGETRVCVDTAPLRERYWARRAGLGFIGLNNHLIIPGEGSYFFLGAIISTVAFRPDEPVAADCGRCGRCVAECPGRAIGNDGSIDCRRCLSYLTIEHRGDFDEDVDLHGHLYGCDVCQQVCPHNSHARQTPISEFNFRPEYASLSAETVAEMTHERFSALFRHSAIKRAKLSGLQRNAKTLFKDEGRVTKDKGFGVNRNS